MNIASAQLLDGAMSDMVKSLLQRRMMQQQQANTEREMALKEAMADWQKEYQHGQLDRETKNDQMRSEDRQWRKQQQDRADAAQDRENSNADRLASAMKNLFSDQSQAPQADPDSGEISGGVSQPSGRKQPSPGDIAAALLQSGALAPHDQVALLGQMQKFTPDGEVAPKQFSIELPLPDGSTRRVQGVHNPRTGNFQILDDSGKQTGSATPIKKPDGTVMDGYFDYNGQTIHVQPAKPIDLSKNWEAIRNIDAIFSNAKPGEIKGARAQSLMNERNYHLGQISRNAPGTNLVATPIPTGQLPAPTPASTPNAATPPDVEADDSSAAPTAEKVQRTVRGRPAWFNPATQQFIDWVK